MVIDFVVDKNAPDTDAYFKDSFGNRISKIMTVVGANASGKTNLLKSIAFLKWFITDSFSDLEPGSQISMSDSFHPFLLCKDRGPSVFEIVFGLIDGIYKYHLEITDEKVLSEILEVKRETNRWNLVFARVLDEKTNEYNNNFAKLDLPSDFEKLVRTNSSVLSAAKQINNAEAVKIVNYFIKIQSSFDDKMGAPNKNAFKALYNVAEFYHKNPNVKAKAEKILRRFDLGISKLEVVPFKQRADTSELYIPFAYHKNVGSDGETGFFLEEESGGTRNLFMLLKDILAALETGDTVIFDELDNNLHPLMVPEIVNLFRSKNHNPKDAQLFFSTHNVQILSELDKQQIVIVEKDEKNISDAWKLDSVEGVRSDENYYTKYLAGVYGGIPKF